MKSKRGNAPLVYSTESGGVCGGCQMVPSRCRCQKKQVLPRDGVVRLTRETKGRKGKGVTLICGLGLEVDALKKLAKALKQKCGSGGAVKNGFIEIQGEQRDLIEKELLARGYRVKRAGG